MTDSGCLPLRAAVARPREFLSSPGLDMHHGQAPPRVRPRPGRRQPHVHRAQRRGAPSVRRCGRPGSSPGHDRRAPHSCGPARSWTRGGSRSSDWPKPSREERTPRNGWESLVRRAFRSRGAAVRRDRRRVGVRAVAQPRCRPPPAPLRPGACTWPRAAVRAARLGQDPARPPARGGAVGDRDPPDFPGDARCRPRDHARRRAGGGFAEPPTMSSAIRLLRDRLAAATAAGRRPLLIVDEAHLIRDPATFETFRLLLNFATAGPPDLSLLLVRDQLDERGLRRPAGAPAARDVLGQREPDRPARRLRRGEALRRGAHDGVPLAAGRQHRDRAHLQHVRPSHEAERRPRVGPRFSTRRSRASRSRSSATGRRRGRSATSTT